MPWLAAVTARNQLKKWKKGYCDEHLSQRESCTCPEPFVLHPFPTEKRDNKARKDWIKVIHRKNPKTGKNWQHKEDDRVRSRHFMDGGPTAANPYPAINVGHWNKTGQLLH